MPIAVLALLACTKAEPPPVLSEEQALEPDAAPVSPLPEPTDEAAAPSRSPTGTLPKLPPPPDPRVFIRNPARVVTLKGDVGPVRGRGLMAGIEVELMPLGNEAVLRVLNRRTTRAWFCGLRTPLVRLHALDENGEEIASPQTCPWDSQPPSGDYWPHAGYWSLEPGQSRVLLRARVRQTKTGLFLQVEDDAPGRYRSEKCMTIDRDSARLRATWLIGPERFRQGWCPTVAKENWDVAGEGRDYHHTEGGEVEAERVRRLLGSHHRVIDVGEIVSNRLAIIAERALLLAP